MILILINPARFSTLTELQISPIDLSADRPIHCSGNVRFYRPTKQWTCVPLAAFFMPCSDVKENSQFLLLPSVPKCPIGWMLRSIDFKLGKRDRNVFDIKFPLPPQHLRRRLKRRRRGRARHHQRAPELAPTTKRRHPWNIRTDRYLGKRFCKMFSDRSKVVLQLPSFPGKQGVL